MGEGAVISALLCAAVCTGAGFWAAWQVQERQRLFLWWQGAFDRMAEAAEREEALPDILCAGDRGRHGPLEQAAAILRFRPGVTPGEWVQAVPREKLLKKEEQYVLDGCLLGLWSPHPKWQRQAISCAAVQWREFLRSGGERRGKARLCRQLGVLGGAALFILLI